MGRVTNGTATFALAALVGLSWLSSDAAARMVYGRSGEPLRRPGTPSFELVFEGGLAEPQGVLADPFDGSGGLGAATGYELGVRFRQHLDDRLAVAPVIQYVDFGDAVGTGDFVEGAGLGYEVATSVIRYGLDLQMFMGRPGAAVRPYLTGGVALAHNRYRDVLQGVGEFTTDMNGPSWTAGVGLKMREMELSAGYVWNRFSTSNLTPGPAKLDYDWDYAVVRLGFAFGSTY